MHRAPTRPRSTRARALVGALLSVSIIAVLGAVPVRAHADLVAATPEPSGTVIEAPDAVELRFSEPIDAALAFVDLLDAGQERVAGLGAVEVEADGRAARVTLPDLEPGTYTVAYQVVSTVDGHATSGAFAFLFDPTGSQAPPVDPAQSSTPAVDGRAVAARWIGLGGGLVALGGLIAWWRSRRLLPLGRAGPPWLTVAAAAIVAYIGLAAYLWLSSRPIVDALPERGAGLPLDFAAPFGWTPFAVAMRVALASSLLTAVVAAAGRLAAPRLDGRPATLVATALAALALGGMSMAAHAAAAGGIGFGLVDWAHLLAVAAWLGGLPAIAVLARRDVARATALTRLLRHHGPMALVAAPIVILTGIANSPLVLGQARGLVASEYGNLLLAKVILVSVALGIGAVNHLALRGRGRVALTALVGAELVVAAAAVGAAATMVTIQPAAARQPSIVSAPIAPAHLFGRAGPTQVHATIDLPTAGSQRYLVTVADAETGAPRDDVQLVFMALTPPQGSGLPAERVDLEPDPRDPRLYGADGAHLSVEGDWGVDVVVRRRGELDERASFVVPVQRRAAPQPVPPPDTGIGVPAPLAATWGVLPGGPAGWLPALVATAGVVATRWWRRASRIRLAVRIGLVAIALVAVGGAGSRALVASANAPGSQALAEHVPPAGFSASPSTGEAIYRANCAACHGLDGDGQGAVRTLPPAGRIDDAVARMSSAELSYRIANGVAGTAMPAFAATLTEEERWHLVRYLEDRWTRP